MIDKPLRWGVIIKGHEIDIRQWRSKLVKPFDPYVDDTVHGPALWCEAIQDAEDAAQAFELAKVTVRSINSAMFHTVGSRLVEADTIVEIKKDGAIGRHVILAMAALEARADVAAVAIVTNAKGEVVEEEPKPSLQQRWLTAAERSENLSDLLAHGFHRDDWYEMYKALEVLEGLHGGEKALLDSRAEQAAEIKALKRTANYYHRHARGKYDKPKRPLTLDEAKTLLTSLIKEAFDQN